MRILVLMKRFGAFKDMPKENFGRQIRLFEPLAQKHHVDFLCPDYQKKETLTFTKNKVRYFIRPLSTALMPRFIADAVRMCRRERYDIIVGTTDPVLSIIGIAISRMTGATFVYEMQDSYKTYDSYRIPFVAALDRLTVKRSDKVLCVSRTLEKEIKKINTRTAVVENGVELSLFRVIDRAEARKKLGIKQARSAKLLCYVGYISPVKGSTYLLDAFAIAKKKVPSLQLLLSGQVDVALQQRIKKEKGIMSMELAKREEVVLALNAADVLCLPNVDNDFSRYCFPYKLIEYMATNTPIAATDVGDAAEVLKQFPGSVASSKDSRRYAACIISQMAKGKVDYRRVAEQYTWEKLAKKVEANLLSAMKRKETIDKDH